MQQELIEAYGDSNLAAYEWYFKKAATEGYENMGVNIPPITVDARKGLSRWAGAKEWLYERLGGFKVTVPVGKYITHNETMKNVEWLSMRKCVLDIVNSKAFMEALMYGDASVAERMLPMQGIDEFLRDFTHAIVLATCDGHPEWSQSTVRVINALNVSNVKSGSTKSGTIIDFGHPLRGPVKVPRMVRTALKAYGLDDDRHLTFLFRKWTDRVSVARTSVGHVENITFSIDPLDFLTLSDNAQGWRSCFSIRGAGEFSCSPIEMMGSPIVLVAYTSPSDGKPYEVAPNGVAIDDKSWRCLCYVTDKMVMVGKGYPYVDDGLAEAVRDRLCEVLGDEWPVKCMDPMEGSHVVSLNTFFSYNDFEQVFMMFPCAYRDDSDEPILMNVTESDESGEIRLVCPACGRAYVPEMDDQFVCDKCEGKTSE